MIQYRLRMANFKGRILFVGDFFQLPPVFKKRSDTLMNTQEYAFQSSAWEYINPLIIELTKTKRTSDSEFFEILRKIRWAQTDKQVLDYLNSLRNNIDKWNKDATVLFARNKEANEMNLLKLNELKGELIIIKAKEKLHVKNLHENKIKNWKNSLPIPCDLSLKIGAKVLFCTNKWSKYYNGERGIIIDITNDYIIVEKENATVKVEKQEFVMSEKDGLICNIDNIFEKSQFYVAISRAINPKKLLLHQSERWIKNIIKVSPKVIEFYKDSEVLRIEEEDEKYTV